MKRGPENLNTLLLLNALRKAKRPVWSDVAKRLRKPRRVRAEVTLSRLDKVTTENQLVVVPGRIVSTGQVTHKMTVGYFAATKSALVRLKQAGVNALPLSQFLQKHGQEKSIKIVV